jgi:RNA recognition motif-containing protein
LSAWDFFLSISEEMVQMNIYVGNLAYDANDEDVRSAFAAYGQVSSATVIKDKISGQSRGFAFVEMPDSNEAQNAISSLNGAPLKGRALKVNEARPREEGGRPGGGGGFRSGPRPGGDRGGYDRRPSGGPGGARRGPGGGDRRGGGGRSSW